MTNLVPGAYRGAVADVGVALEAPSLVGHFIGREAYRRSRWIVVANGSDHALIAVHRDDEESLFAPITAIEVLAGPDAACLGRRPDIGSRIPSWLARATAEDPAAADARRVVVRGRYGHTSASSSTRRQSASGSWRSSRRANQAGRARRVVPRSTS